MKDNVSLNVFFSTFCLKTYLLAHSEPPSLNVLIGANGGRTAPPLLSEPTGLFQMQLTPSEHMS